MSGKTVALALVLALTVALQVTGEEKAKQKPIFEVDISHEFNNPKETFEEVKNLILEQYYSDSITEKALYWAAIKGMLRQVSPPETPDLCTIWRPEQYEKVAESLKGEQVSIGIKSSFSPGDASLTVTEILPGSPAESVIQPYDRVLRIDGQPLKGKSINEIDALLQGGVGTNVVLTIVRDIKVFDLTIKRESFKVANLSVAVLPEKVGYASVRNITSGISQELDAELKKLKEQEISKLILDLRNNGGGVFAEALRVAELFLPEKHILLRTVTRAEGLQNYVSINKEPYTFDMIVLANKNTASSCEILVGALQDHKIAQIVGNHTYGKSVFEKTFELKNDYRVKFIIGALYTPRGKSWHSQGITPDFAADLDPNALNALAKLDPAERLAKDVGLLTAYKLLLQKK
jgi:carboxyl-terminal processing protease